MGPKRWTGALSSQLTAWPVIISAPLLALISGWAGLVLTPALLLLLGLLGLLSRLWGAFSLRGVDAKLTCPQAVLFAGESVDLTYTVENNKLLPLVWLEVCQSVPLNGCMVPDHTFSLYQMDEAEASASGASALYRRRLLFLPGGRSLSWESRWTARRRGVYQLPELLLRSGDGFGLSQSEKAVPQSAVPTLVVYPKLVEVDPSPFLRSVWQGPTGRRGHVEDPTVVRALREYQPGDPWKRIDWRAVARQNELLVKQVESVLPASIHFILDGGSFFKHPGGGEELEEALSILGSLLLELNRAGVACGLSLPAAGEHPPVTLPPAAPSLTVHDLMLHLAAFDGDRASGLFQREQLAALSHSVGQLWLVEYGGGRSAERDLPELLEGRGLGVLFWAGSPPERCRALPLPSLKRGGKPP